MIAIILAAGYGTRLYPLTLDTPKPLLSVGKIPIIERVLGKIYELQDVDDIYIVTNSKFCSHFTEWMKNYTSKVNVNRNLIIVDDGTTSNEERLGSVGDIVFVLKKYNLDDDLLVIAGDNLFEFSLEKLRNLSEEKNASTLAVCDLQSLDYIRKRFGVVVTDENSRVIDFEEKPKYPKSTLAATAIYIFRKADIRYINELYDRPHDGEINAGGTIIELLRRNIPVYSQHLDIWFDIGTTSDLEKAYEYYVHNP